MGAGGRWLAGGAALGALLCLAAVLEQRRELGALRAQLEELRGRLQDPWGGRDRRELGTPPARAWESRTRAVLHLVPNSRFSVGEGDVTEVAWEPALRQGRALEPAGPLVTVRSPGLYLVYSQVLFTDPTFTMGQVLVRGGRRGPPQPLLRCVRSMAAPPRAHASCFTAGVFRLRSGDRLHLRVPRANASFDLSAHGTFLGIVRL